MSEVMNNAMEKLSIDADIDCEKVVPASEHDPKNVVSEDAGEDSDESDDDDYGNDDDDDEDDEDDTEEEVKPPPKVEVTSSHKKKYKKRKRKKKTKNENRGDDEDWEALANVGNLDNASKGKEAEAEKQEEFVPLPDSIFSAADDEALRKMANEIYSTTWAIYMERKTEEEKETSLYLSLLHPSLKEISVDSRLLSADAELKKLFGAKVVEAERRNEEQELAAIHGGGGGGRRRGGRGRGKMRPMRTNAKFSLINPRDGWFSSAAGLSMVPEDKESNVKGIRYFKYVHDGMYLKLQADYNIAVQTMDPNNIQAIVSRYPFHIDSLLQFSEVFRSMGELDRAAEYVERAIYILEGSWNLAFKPFNGEGRIRFEIPENKAIFVALARYVLLLSRRGLYRTSLEISKLILNFDPDSDPMGILLLIDSFALLSHQYAWICDMRENYQLIPLKYFPNFALSMALALHAIKDGDGKRLGGASSSTTKPSKKSKKKSQSQQNNIDPSKYNNISVHEHLTETLLTFPMVLRPLLAATKDSGGSWSSHWLYSSSNNHGIDGVFYRIAKIYAARSHLLWAAPEAKALLFRAAESATVIADKKGDDERNARAKLMRKEASEWFTQCGMYRTLQVADFADSGAPEITQDLLDNDEGDTGPVGAAAPPEVRNVGIAQSMREFLHSLLPWRDAEAAVQEAEEAVRNSPDDPMNAIRELVNNRGWLNGQNGAEQRDDGGERNDEDNQPND